MFLLNRLQKYTIAAVHTLYFFLNVVNDGRFVAKYTIFAVN